MVVVSNFFIRVLLNLTLRSNEDMKKLEYRKYLISFFLIFLVFTSCKKDEENDPMGIYYGVEEEIEGMVVETTELGFTILSRHYGFLDLTDSIPEEWRVDGMLVKARINRGKTYFDDADGSIDNIETYRYLTFAKLVTLEEDPSLYIGPKTPYIKIVWSPDFSDDIVKYEDGYGYVVQAKESGYIIGQYHFPALEGLGTFKTQLEARKMGMYVLYLMTTSDDLPGTDKFDLDFLKIDWYMP